MTGRLPDQPVGLPVSLQNWESLTFLHWAIRPEVVQRLLPDGLEVDSFDGDAWVGVTPFRMRDVRAGALPPVPLLSVFAEVNLRTYVRARDGTSGLWFFSLECPRLAVVLALRAFAVPYRWADVEMVDGADRYEYRSRRRDAQMRAVVTVGESVEADERLDFLTGRWSAYTHRWGRLWRVPVEHEPWPLHQAEAHVAVGSLLAAAGLPTVREPPLVHFSPGVHSRIGAPRPVPAPRVSRRWKPPSMSRNV
ncbi:YqjF family protein [Georgenia subflava]|uniref:DUF2071 domain-containing protein n=1 Tax=Georgenia subflava TaxID=1622177 RepID=A0A6N7EK97_9MICO|nr:DUF2071 domain-containing protein [Georgenia subflava]MPV36626.1 DUF2071 domain-containing protein [Georgenia subflava]